MAFKNISEDLSFIQKLSDEPNDETGLSAAELKAEFDKAGNAIKSYINNTLLPQLEREGADHIGMTELPELPSANIRTAFQSLNRRISEAVLGQIPDGSITETKIFPGSIGEDALAAASVGEEKLREAAVSEGKIKDGAVTENKIAPGAVSQLKLGEGAVSEEKLSKGAVTESKIAPEAVTAGKIKDGALDHRKLGKGCVWGDNLAAEVVSGDKIAPGAVSGNRLKKAAESALGGVRLKAATDEMEDYAGIDAEGFVRLPGSRIKLELIWENASKTSAFPAQKLSFDLSDCSFLLLEFYSQRIDSGTPVPTRMLKLMEKGCPKTTVHLKNYPHDGWDHFREMSCDNSGVKFEDGAYMHMSLESKQGNDGIRAIPTRIWKVKGVVNVQS